jgi:hypothetical protein
MGLQTAAWYEAFGTREARGQSPAYEALALGIAADRELLQRIDELPPYKRQPNLLFAATQYLSGPTSPYDAFRVWLDESWGLVTEVMLAKATQTNEPGRMATLLPLLARLRGPLALLEVGASAGLCLYPDRWRYQYGDEVVGRLEDPVLRCQPVGSFVAPRALPEIAWRGGLDLNPLDVMQPDDVRWLEALVWPDQPERLLRLRTAVEVARNEPPQLMRGNLLTDLEAVASQVPSDLTLVVIHSAVLTYVDEAKRQGFVDRVTALPGHWVSNEGAHVLPSIAARLSVGPSDDEGRFLTALDGEPLAWSRPHGQSIEWI